mgnify:CR=1 FL=1
MKSTGMTRRLDDLGRIVIPREIRSTLQLHEGDPMEILISDDGDIVLRKYSVCWSVERELIAGLATMRGQFPGMKIIVLDKDTEPLSSQMVTDEEHKIAKTASSSRSCQQHERDTGGLIMAVPVVVNGETWAVFTAVADEKTPTEVFHQAMLALKTLCKYMGIQFSV